MKCYLVIKSQSNDYVYGRLYLNHRVAMDEAESHNQAYIVNADNDYSLQLLIMDWKKANDEKKPFFSNEGIHCRMIQFLLVKENNEIKFIHNELKNSDGADLSQHMKKSKPKYTQHYIEEFEKAISQFNLTSEVKLEYAKEPEFWRLKRTYAVKPYLTLSRLFLKTKDRCINTRNVSMLHSYTFFDFNPILSYIEVNFEVPCNFKVETLSNFMNIIKKAFRQYEYVYEPDNEEDDE